MKRTQRPANRRLIVIDVENVNAGPVKTIEQAEWCERVIREAVSISTVDQLVIGCNADPVSVFTIHEAWKGRPRIVVGTGRDGADKALISVLGENLSNRYDELALVSGDHIFAPAVSSLALGGLPTHVYSHPGHLARTLRLAATDVSPVIKPATDGTWKMGA